MLGLKKAIKAGPPLYRTQNIKELNLLRIQKNSPKYLSSNPPLRVCYLLGIVLKDRDRADEPDKVPAH